MANSDVIVTDGSVDWSGGIDSLAVTTIQSQRNPNGLQRNQLAWLNNATVRDGGITCRSGFQQLANLFASSSHFQGKFMYIPEGANPYLIYAVSGHIYKYDIENDTLYDLTEAFPSNVPQFNPDGDSYAVFCQGQQFLVIQAGDDVTLPFIWDGNILRRSNGITSIVGGQSGVAYTIDPQAQWTVPPVAGTITITLDEEYGGVVGDIGTYTVNQGDTNVGTFEVTAKTAVAPFTMTLETVSSNQIGKKIRDRFRATFQTNDQPAPTGISELPASGAMDYFMGRFWYAQGRGVSAGDIVGGPSGTAAYNFMDSILRVTENPLVLGGDGFQIPSNDGSTIRAIKHSANIDAALGDGRLFVSTRKAIYALNVPVTRDDWIAAGNSNQPLLTVVQLDNGWVNDRSVVAVNGDLFGQSLEPAIRSLNQTMRYFGQWGNISISANESRILQYNDRSLIRYSSGMYYDNRLLETSLPERTDQGVISHALVPLDFTPISSFNKQKEPNWEGMYEGLDFFQLCTGDFGGRERSFATVRSKVDQRIQLWELVAGTKFDNSLEYGENRITWVVEFPAFTWGDENELKRLVGAEMWIDRLTGVVQFTMQYRPDGQACWIDWHLWKKCSTKNSVEDVNNPIAYPTTNCLESYFSTMALPLPPRSACTTTGRPSDTAYQFQFRLIVTGFCRVRGLFVHANKLGRKLYDNITC